MRCNSTYFVFGQKFDGYTTGWRACQFLSENSRKKAPELNLSITFANTKQLLSSRP